MSRSVYSFAIAAICASTVLASAQVKSSTTEVAPSSVAYVYVTSNPANGGGEIYGATVAANGSATLIPGSPFLFNVNYMAVNRAWLFGVANLDNSIDSFSIAANGALSLENTVAVPTGGGVISIYLDHTGSTLYADYYTTNNDFYSYSIDQSTGQLSQIGDLPGGPPDNTPMSFIGNNVYAYSSSCYHFGPEIIGVQRASSGTLTYINNFNPPFPAEKSGGIYCPCLAAADPTNHLAIAMVPLTLNWDQDGRWQLATYTADSAGNLTTNSTYSNMPSVLVGGVNDYRMSPSGQYLAVGGTKGFQIFHFNGANPITPYTGLLTSTRIDQIFWDNSNHVYALSRSASEVFVYTVTSTAVTRAPGSPHKVPSAGSLIVLPK
jgi:hypothetical protein